jgi:hypothetical protein
MTPTPEAKTFYSAAAGLILNINVGRRVIEEGGTTKMVDQKIAEFSPIGDGYGRLVTVDPEVIEKLSTRMATHGDVFDAAEYTRRTTPAEVQIKMLQEHNQRLVEDHNRLLAKLAEDGKLKETKPSR